MMCRLGTMLLVFLAAACSDHTIPTAPTTSTPAQPYTPPPPPPPVVVSVRDVTLGERVEDRFGDATSIRPGEHHFFVTMPNSGTLAVSLSWDPFELGTLLMLKLEDREFRPSGPSWSPVIGRLRVEAGKRYLIAVALAGADWIPDDPFVLTTVLEP